jgi:predicted RNA-binding protein
MCLATVYIERNGQREELMRDVAWIHPQPEGLELTSLLGGRQLVRAQIQSIDLMHSLIVLEQRGALAAEGGDDG